MSGHGGNSLFAEVILPVGLPCWREVEAALKTFGDEDLAGVISLPLFQV